jgi:hypothetical protein
MESINTQEYGYALASGYSIDTDLALVRSEFESGWTRQRRSYLHNASLLSVSWLLNPSKAQGLVFWLQGLDSGAFFLCPILSGNDSSGPIVNDVQIRRTSVISTERIENTNKFRVSFEAETRAFADYQAKADAVAGSGPLDYPSTLPLPLQAGFASEHASRNLTVYSLTYEMNTETLGRWLDFAGFAGTAWFKTRMVSANVPCGFEYIRFIGNISQSLVGPDKWQVSVSAESRLATSVLDEFLPPGGLCTYDSGNVYDYTEEEYDCGGEVPPQGDFVMPSGLVTVSASASGTAPQTAQAVIIFNSNGTVSTTPAGSPAWTIWHTDPSSLPSPGVALSTVAEVSLDGGATWVFYTPGAFGPFLPLTSQVRIRNRVSDNISRSESLGLTLTFESGVVGGTFATAQVTLNASITVTNPGQGIIPSFALSDSFFGATPEGETAGGISLGVTIMPDGRSFTYTGGGAGAPWYDPITAGAGNGKWIVVTKVSGINSTGLEGVRIPMNAPLDYSIFQPESTNQSNFASYNGTLAIYDAATGGNLLGSGTLIFEGEITP